MHNRPVLTLTIFLTLPLFAAEYKPYPVANISVGQWQEYFEVVESELGDTREEIGEAHLVLFRDEESRTFYAFTMSEHPAHPAWVTRKVVEDDGEISMIQIGYFAGDEEPFAELFQDYAALIDQIRVKFEVKDSLQQ